MQNKLLDQMTSGYTEAAYRTDTGENEQPSADLELAPGERKKARNECKAFIEAIRQDTLGLYPDSMEQMGHDFWLTRNHHGVGFWDRANLLLHFYDDKTRNYMMLREHLTNVAHTFKEVSLSEGAGGMLYFE